MRIRAQIARFRVRAACGPDIALRSFPSRLAERRVVTDPVAGVMTNVLFSRACRSWAARYRQRIVLV